MVVHPAMLASDNMLDMKRPFVGFVRQTAILVATLGTFADECSRRCVHPITLTMRPKNFVPLPLTAR